MAGGGTICAHADCDQPGKFRCVRCRTVFYCSEEHQRMHWKEGGHKRHCTPAPKAAAAAAAAADAAVPPPPSASGLARAPSSTTAAAASAGPRKVCGACRVPKPVAAFSNSQLKKKAKRRCLECFEAGRLVAEPGTGGDPVNS